MVWYVKPTHVLVALVKELGAWSRQARCPCVVVAVFSPRLYGFAVNCSGVCDYYNNVNNKCLIIMGISEALHLACLSIGKPHVSLVFFVFF